MNKESVYLSTVNLSIKLAMSTVLKQCQTYSQVTVNSIQPFCLRTYSTLWKTPVFLFCCCYQEVMSHFDTQLVSSASIVKQYQ